MDNKMKVWSALEALKIMVWHETKTQVRRHMLLSDSIQVLFLKLTQVFNGMKEDQVGNPLLLLSRWGAESFGVYFWNP